MLFSLNKIDKFNCAITIITSVVSLKQFPHVSIQLHRINIFKFERDKHVRERIGKKPIKHLSYIIIGLAYRDRIV